jgi:sulfur carrier protein ThiS
MQVFFINNHGGGFADTMSVRDGITVGELFNQQMPGCEPHDYLIRVNRQPCTADQVIREGDRISITPTKIEGARTAA